MDETAGDEPETGRPKCGEPEESISETSEPGNAGRDAWELLGRSAGLCETCIHARLRPTRRSAFLHCALSEIDRRFPKYPPLPVMACPGWQPEVAGA